MSDMEDAEPVALVENVVARIDLAAKTVNLKGRVGLPPGRNFHVAAGGKVAWKLLDAATGQAATFPVRVAFVVNPGAVPLFEPSVFAANGQASIVTTAANPLAKPTKENEPPVEYRYHFELDHAPFTRLKCIPGDGSSPAPDLSSGGEKGGAPRSDG
jgi:hypothetical protein